MEIEHGSSRHLGNNPAHPISISSHECNICRSNNDLIQLINPNNKRRIKKYKQRKKKSKHGVEAEADFVSGPLFCIMSKSRRNVRFQHRANDERRLSVSSDVSDVPSEPTSPSKNANGSKSSPITEQVSFQWRMASESRSNMIFTSRIPPSPNMRRRSRPSLPGRYGHL